MSEIQGEIRQLIDTQAYRKIKRLSYSSLKLFADDRKKFYKEEILGEKKNVDEDDESMGMGNITDVLLTDEEHKDSYFLISSVNPPTGQLLTFVQSVYSLHKINRNIDGDLTIPFAEIMGQAYEIVKEGNGGKLRDSLETFVKNFSSKGGKEYLIELIASEGKKVISIEQMQMGEKIVKSLKESDVVGRIVHMKGDGVYTKFPILYTYKGWELKSEIDKMWVDHENKTIHIWDFKCTAFVEHFLTTYLKYRYYLQQTLYRIAVMSWAKENGLQHYSVEYMGFVCSDSINYCKPLLYQMNFDNFEQGIKGFNINGRSYKGVDQLLDDISLHEETGEWGMSADNIRSKGIVKIPVFNSYI